MAYIYIITAADHAIKIGVARDPYARLDELQTGCPFKLGLYAKFKIANRKLALKYEHLAHRRLRYVRLNGEWFKIEPAQAAALITRAIGGAPKNTDAEIEREAAKAFPHQHLLTCPYCKHQAHTRLSNKEIWRRTFKCTQCGARVPGKRFYIRRVA
jgi:ribosomal protein L37AE/L43A